MITAQAAVQTLIEVNRGKYQESASGTCVREFTAIESPPKYQFILEAPLRDRIESPVDRSPK